MSETVNHRYGGYYGGWRDGSGSLHGSHSRRSGSGYSRGRRRGNGHAYGIRNSTSHSFPRTDLRTYRLPHPERVSETIFAISTDSATTHTASTTACHKTYHRTRQRSPSDSPNDTRIRRYNYSESRY